MSEDDMSGVIEEGLGSSRDHAPAASFALEDRRPIESAPKDGEMIWLLVDYTDGGAALADTLLGWTIGFNNLGNTDEDLWEFAGWCWSQDHFTHGAGTPVAWKPLGFDLDADHA